MATSTDAATLTVEGDLQVYNEDHFECAGDIHVNGNLLVELIRQKLFGGETWSHEEMGYMGDLGRVFGRVRVTVERLP